MLCVCGAECSECLQFEKECMGCEAIGGRVYWASYIGKEACPYYSCVKEKSLKNCGDCEKLPCGLWRQLKDPSWTDEEHEESIRKRVAKFNSMKK